MFYEKKIKSVLTETWGKVGAADRERIEKLAFPENIHEVSRNYGDDPDGYQSLSYFWPAKGAANLPVIVDIHGGGFMYGTKELNRPYASYLASLGFMVMSMSYRLTPRVRLKDQLCDIYDAIAFMLKDNTPADFSRAFITGDSAGGMLAGVFAAAQESNAIYGLFGRSPLALHFKAAALTHPAAYLHGFGPGTSFQTKIVAKTMCDMLYGPFYSRDRKLERTTGNFTDMVKLAGGFIPVFLLTSKGDTAFHDNALEMKKVLAEKGVACELMDSTEKPDEHVFNVTHINSAAAEKANAELVAFFRAHAA